MEVRNLRIGTIDSLQIVMPLLEKKKEKIKN